LHCSYYAAHRQAKQSINAAGDKLLVFTQEQSSDYGSIMLVELDRHP
jgi:hypothetical protein